MERHLALDGPDNGMYIGAEEAAEHGYTLSPWSLDPESETVYLHTATTLAATNDDGIPVEFEEDGYER